MDKRACCPVCGSDDLRTLYSIDSQLAAQYFVNNDIKRIVPLQAKIEKLWSGKSSSYCCCKHCSFEFALPFIAADANIYSLIYQSETHYPAEKWEYKVTLENIDLFLKTHTEQVNLLEIGAGNGSFIKGLLKNRRINHMFTTEFSEAGAKAIESLGIKCFRKDFTALTKDEIQSKFQVVCLFQVLEHMTGIHEFFIHLNLFTDPGARLYLSVPNNLQRKFYDRFKFFYDLPPVHVGRYNPRCLAELCHRYGWRILNHFIQPTFYKGRIKKFLFERFAFWQNTFASEKLNIKLLRLILRYGIYLLITIRYIRIIMGLRKQHLGTAQWFALERIN